MYQYLNIWNIEPSDPEVQPTPLSGRFSWCMEYGEINGEDGFYVREDY